ncbi:MAG TPA: hypothetical protein VFF69_11610 [Phycisphaerales bacterium]|nr:hypothetical protein [Phycisphaerales bacterium]
MTTESRVALRAAPPQLALVMDHMDRAELAWDVASKRRYKRHAFRSAAPSLLQCRRGDETITYEVAPRNISARGASVLFSAFIYPQTVCDLVVPRAAGGALRIRGTLRWCRHVSRTLHEGGIEFRERIDLAEMIPGIAETDGDAMAPATGAEYRIAQEAALRLAMLARDARPVPELREELERIRRALDREEAARRSGIQ